MILCKEKYVRPYLKPFWCIAFWGCLSVAYATPHEDASDWEHVGMQSSRAALHRTARHRTVVDDSQPQQAKVTEPVARNEPEADPTLRQQALRQAATRSQQMLCHGFRLSKGSFAPLPVFRVGGFQSTPQKASPQASGKDCYTKTFAVAQAMHEVQCNALTMDMASSCKVNIPAFGLGFGRRSGAHGGQSTRVASSRMSYLATGKRMYHLVGYQVLKSTITPASFDSQFLCSLDTLGTLDRYDAAAVQDFVSEYGEVVGLVQYYGAYQFHQAAKESVNEEKCRSTRGEIAHKMQLMAQLEDQEKQAKLASEGSRNLQWQQEHQQALRQQIHKTETRWQCVGGHDDRDNNLDDCVQAFAEDEQQIAVTKMDEIIPLDQLVARYLLAPVAAPSTARQQAHKYLRTYFGRIDPPLKRPVRLRNLETGLYLCRERCWYNPFLQLSQRPLDGDINKIFRIYATGINDLCFIFSSVRFGYTLHIKLHGKENGTSLVSFPHCQQRNEMFALHGERRGEQDCFQIISAWSGKALDVAIPYHDGAAVHTWTPHGGDRQRWVIEEVREEERS